MNGLALKPIVLASGSVSRRAMFEAAGIAAILDKPDVDEDALKRDSVRLGISTEGTAMRLARAKADAVSARHPGQTVIGADQMLECGGEWFDKPADLTAAAAHLRRLSGRRHRLVSAVAVFRDRRRLWETVDSAELVVRPLSAAFIDKYLEVEGERVLSSVGAYRIEGPGIHLFESIHGDHFTILGLPLLPLLDFLRHEETLAS